MSVTKVALRTPGRGRMQAMKYLFLRDSAGQAMPVDVDDFDLDRLLHKKNKRWLEVLSGDAARARVTKPLSVAGAEMALKDHLMNEVEKAIAAGLAADQIGTEVARARADLARQVAELAATRLLLRGLLEGAGEAALPGELDAIGKVDPSKLDEAQREIQILDQELADLRRELEQAGDQANAAAKANGPLERQVANLEQTVEELREQIASPPAPAPPLDPDEVPGGTELPDGGDLSEVKKARGGTGGKKKKKKK